MRAKLVAVLILWLTWAGYTLTAPESSSRLFVCALQKLSLYCKLSLATVPTGKNTVLTVTFLKGRHSVEKNFSSRFRFVFLIILTVVACSTPTKTVYTEVTKGTLKAGDKIPVPTKDVILTVTGKIGTTNKDNAIKMDLPTVESVGLVDYKVTDPFEKKDAVFRGPLMNNLLDLWQISKEATKLHIVALNDYVVDVPIAEVRKYPVVFALQQDGQYMPVSTRGPAMLVFPYNDFQFNQTVFNDYWAWQIKTIEVQ